MSAIRENGSVNEYVGIERAFSARENGSAGVVLHSATLNEKQVSSNSLPTKLFHRTNLSHLFFFHSFIQRQHTSVGNAHAKREAYKYTSYSRSIDSNPLAENRPPYSAVSLKLFATTTKAPCRDVVYRRLQPRSDVTPRRKVISSLSTFTSILCDVVGRSCNLPISKLIDRFIR